MNDALVIAEPDVDEPIVSRDRTHQKDSRSRPKRQPPYAVIVHNDESHTWPYVIELLQRVCGLNLQKASLLTSTIHHAGRAVVWTGAREVAELKRDQIRAFGTDFYPEIPVKFPLGVTLEPLPGD